MDPIVIAGSGLAGYNLAREIRKLDKEIPLVIVTSDGGEYYSKPMLSNALATKKQPAQLAMSSAEQMATTLPATVRPRTTITAIDTVAHTVAIGAETLRYSKLVLALGAEQVRLPLEGSGADAVLTVNDLDDYACFRAAIAGKTSVAVIGGGLIGCEFANDLSATGHKVHVIDIADQPLPRLLPPAGGAMMEEKLSALGVVWHFGASAKSVDRNADGMRITLSAGTTLDVDVVLSAVGLRPRTDMARAAGISVNRGIIVDRMLQTSAADVYALGDCIEIETMIMPYVMPIMNAARALAPTLTGKPTKVTYPAMPVMVKTPACPTIVSPPAPGAQGDWQVEASGDGVKSLFVGSDGKLLGYALNGAATAERQKLTPQLPPVLA